MVNVLPPASNGDFELPPEGSFLAVCYRVMDLGTQMTHFEGVARPKHQIMVSWELPTERMTKDGRPFSVHKRYNWSMHENATMRKHLEAWRGKAFDEETARGFQISRLIGIGCYLQVVHRDNGGRTFANIAAVMALPKGTTAPKPENVMMFLDLDNFDKSVWDQLSESLQAVILKSPEGQKAVNGGAGVAAHDLDDEIPF